MLDFRRRLVARLGRRFATANKVMGVLKLVFSEAFYRQDIDANPAQGIGNVKTYPQEAGTFTAEELRKLFPADSLGPWRNTREYTCFLLAATTRTRRSEVPALR